MKIVHVSRQYHPGIGGLESFTRNLCEEQVRAGHHVRMVTLHRIFDGDGATLPAYEEIGGVEVNRVPYRGSRRYPFAPSVLEHLKDCDIVHVHGVDFFADFLAATRFLHRKPLILSTHGGFFHSGFARALKTLYFRTISRLSLGCYRTIIACSQPDHTAFAKVCNRLVLVENGVDTAKFAGLARPDARSIIYFGRLASNKRLDLLIRWFASLYQLDPTWSLIIAGKPMGVAIDDLRAMAAAAGLGQAVEFHDSPKDEALKALISRCSIFASASDYEGFGISLIEAVSAGLYPAVSDIPAHRNSCAQLGVGSLIDFRDTRSAIRLLNDASAAKLSGAVAAAQKPLQKYGWSSVSARMVAIYNVVLGNESRSIGPVSVSVLSNTEAVADLVEHIQKRVPRPFAFCNAHLANMARKDEKLVEALKDARVFNDGIGVDIASYLRYGTRFPANLNGTDLLPALFRAYPGTLKIFLVGSVPGIAEKAARAIERDYPNVKVAGVQHGFFDPQAEAALNGAIIRSGADLVIACMGNPRQEKWAARWCSEFQRPVLCAGAFLDFTAGQVTRAPRWVRAIRFEWAYRLVQEPTRLADRYLRGNIIFLVHAIKDAWRGPEWSDDDVAAPAPAMRSVDAA